MAYTAKAYPGAAAETTLNGSISAGATTFTVATGAGTGYPDGSGGPFYVILDYDKSTAEKVLVTSRTGDVFTATRGVDGTSGQSHADGAKVRAVWTATDAQEANVAVVQTVGRIAAKGDLLTGASANTTAKTAAGANDTLLVADSTQAGGVRWTASLAAATTIGGVSGTQLAADRASWSTVAPTFHNVTSGTAVALFYKLVGKTLIINLPISGGTVTSTGTFGFDLPASLVARTAQTWQVLLGIDSTGALKVFRIGGGNTEVDTIASTASGTNLANMTIFGCIEVN